MIVLKIAPHTVTSVATMEIALCVLKTHNAPAGSNVVLPQLSVMSKFPASPGMIARQISATTPLSKEALVMHTVFLAGMKLTLISLFARTLRTLTQYQMNGLL